MQVDRSTAILTGMIFAALYVILLVSFLRTHYLFSGAPFVLVSQSGAQPSCAPPPCSAEPGSEQQECLAALRVLRRWVNAPAPLSAVEQAMRR